MKQKVLVVDLDETLYSINTFHYFIIFLVRDCVRRFKLLLLIKLLGILGLRILKRVSHAKMKYRILKAIRSRTDLNIETFVSSIALKKRNLPILKANFDVTILATGAPSCYAAIIAKNEAFDYCISTDFPEQGFYETYENIKTVKKNNVINYLKTRDLEAIDVFVTDHIDDLPLMKFAKHNIIVNPGPAMVAELEQNLISFETMY